jgi:7-cyano-7-deazaguanine reductase
MAGPSLDTFPNPSPHRDYEIAIRCPEFTSLCPKTGLPDFGEIRITYVPDAKCLELKALKYYMVDFRNRGIFYEAVTNQILDDLVAVCAPRRMTVVGDFSVRGGISTTVTATYEKDEGRRAPAAPAARARRDQPPPRLRRSAGALAKAEAAERERAAKAEGGAPRALKKEGRSGEKSGRK